MTLIGLVRAAPPEDTAIRQWSLDPATAKAVREQGTYLHVTEIRQGIARTRNFDPWNQKNT